MITVEQARKIDPTLQEFSDAELEQIIADLYKLGHLALESFGSKIGGAEPAEIQVD